jgi:hypothetical protein
MELGAFGSIPVSSNVALIASYIVSNLTATVKNGFNLHQYAHSPSCYTHSYEKESITDMMMVGPSPRYEIHVRSNRDAIERNLLHLSMLVVSGYTTSFTAASTSPATSTTDGGGETTGSTFTIPLYQSRIDCAFVPAGSC